MNVFVLDNFDSFTYNLVHILEQISDSVIVKRNNQVNINELVNFDKIVFSPGPGIPSDVQIMFDILDKYKETKSILGVCLGHQAIAEYFGAKLTNMNEVNHGREFETNIINNHTIFENIPSTFYSGRYHSWIVSQENFPEELSITSVDENNRIMSLKHNKYKIHGVQFHPESIMTPHGKTILENWIQKRDC